MKRLKPSTNGDGRVGRVGLTDLARINKVKLDPTSHLKGHMFQYAKNDFIEGKGLIRRTGKGGGSRSILPVPRISLPPSLQIRKRERTI